MRTIPAGDVERVVLEQLRSLFRSPELVARTYAAARQQETDEVERLTALKTELEEKSGRHENERSSSSREIMASAAAPER